MKQKFKTCLIPILLLLLMGCASQKPQKVWKSLPVVQVSSLEIFDIQIKPLKLDNPFFVAFELTVQNKTSLPLEINWNKSRYYHRGQNKGLFVFKGIEPKAIKKRTIPNEIIPAGNRKTKRISPARTIAWLSREQIPKPGEGAFIPGMLPSGDNGVSLVLQQNDKEWRQTLTLKIIKAILK